ncbi:MAG: hypothetical protein AB1585_02235 [Thermodesulfobacteriota bacterium]
MRCPKCGFISFDYLETCVKCNADLIEERRRLNLPGFHPHPISLQEIQDRVPLMSQKEKETIKETVIPKSKLPETPAASPATSRIVPDQGFALDLSAPFDLKKPSRESAGSSLGEKDLELSLEGLEINIKPND